LRLTVIKTTDRDTWRSLITFASFELANAWWRAIQEASSKREYASFRRLSPHLFTYSKNDLGDQAAKCLNDNEPTSSFRGKMFFTYLPDLGTGDRPRLWPLPSLPQRDPISGHTSVYVSFSSGEFRRLIDLTDSLSEARRHHIYTGTQRTIESAHLLRRVQPLSSKKPTTTVDSAISPIIRSS
jgi:hypothetical protein